MRKGMGKNAKEDNRKKNHEDKNGRADYPVGYKKPPQHKQFKPGQSGNVKGRPRKPASVTDVLATQLKRTVLVNIGGKPQKVTMLEAIAMTHIGQAAKGDHKSASLVFNQLKPGEETQNNNLPELIQQFRAMNASRKTDDPIVDPSVKPERDLIMDSDPQANNSNNRDDDHDKEKH